VQVQRVQTTQKVETLFSLAAVEALQLVDVEALLMYLVVSVQELLEEQFLWSLVLALGQQAVL
jgi:hypothetical protein